MEDQTTTPVQEDKENIDPQTKPEPETGPAAKQPKKKRSRKEPKETEDREQEQAAPKKPKKEKPKKVLSNLARKKSDDRYVQNGKGRYVSKKKSENGKKNVQARAIKCGRKLLGLEGQMVLLGRGKKGEHLLQLTKTIRQMLKDGVTDEEAEKKCGEDAKKMVEEIKSEES